MAFGSGMMNDTRGSAAVVAHALPLPLPTLPSLVDGPAVCVRGSESFLG